MSLAHLDLEDPADILEACEPLLRRAPHRSACAFLYNPASGEVLRSASYASKQRARQKAIRLSEELEVAAFVVAREGAALVLYAASERDPSGWRCVRGGLERPLGRRELAERYLLKPGSKLRLSPLGA